MKLGELWAGNIYGTNTGRIFLELHQQGDTAQGILRLSDDQHGLAILTAAGRIENDVLLLECQPTEQSDDVASGRVVARARLKESGSLTGEWQSDIGTAGTFELHPHAGAGNGLVESGPEQLYTATRNLGALRLYRADLLSLIATIERKFPTAQVVVTHLDRGAELARYSRDFKQDIDRLMELRWIKINAQMAATQRLQRVLTIDLGPVVNRITAQGPDESWALGEVEAITASLRDRESKLSTTWGRYHVNVNQLIALGALIAMPDLPTVPRAAFMLSIVVLLIGAYRLQKGLIPNFIVNIVAPKPTWIARAWPSLLSWLISATAGVVASLIYGWLADSNPL